MYVNWSSYIQTRSHRSMQFILKLDKMETSTRRESFHIIHTLTFELLIKQRYDYWIDHICKSTSLCRISSKYNRAASISKWYITKIFIIRGPYFLVYTKKNSRFMKPRNLTPRIRSRCNFLPKNLLHGPNTSTRVSTQVSTNRTWYFF